jgi:hypothetical protein
MTLLHDPFGAVFPIQTYCEENKEFDSGECVVEHHHGLVASSVGDDYKLHDDGAQVVDGTVIGKGCALHCLGVWVEVACVEQAHQEHEWG